MLKDGVLPAPFGPIRLTVESRGIVKSVSSTASRPPNSLRSERVVRMSALIGQPLPNERREGACRPGEPGGSPDRAARRGFVGETWFPPRERAEGERPSRLDVLDRRVVDSRLELELAPLLGEEPLRPEQHHE